MQSNDCCSLPAKGLKQEVDSYWATPNMSSTSSLFPPFYLLSHGPAVTDFDILVVRNSQPSPLCLDSLPSHLNIYDTLHSQHVTCYTSQITKDTFLEAWKNREPHFLHIAMRCNAIQYIGICYMHFLHTFSLLHSTTFAHF